MPDPEEGEDTAKLAGLDPLEKGLPVDWQRVLAFYRRVEAVRSVNAEAVLPEPLHPEPPLREDRTRPSFSRDAIMGNTPFTRHGFFRVPRVMP